MKHTPPFPARVPAVKSWFAFALLCLSTLNPQLSTVFAQGSLTPPGAPAPTMKTLDQVEPRKPIGASTTPGDADSLFKITQPGSYYLTTNITGVAAKHGIEIAASGVTLDLMGFELAGSSNSLDGVNVSVTATNLAIHNGSVRGWGGEGVDAGSARNSQLERLAASSNGSHGIFSGIANMIRGCTARNNTGRGITTGLGCTVSDCTVSDNTDDGISASDGSTVTGCTAYNNTGNGISTGSSCTVTGCTAHSNTGDGISASVNSTVSGCTARSNTGDGISASGGSTVSGCTASSNTGDGIEVTTNSRVVDNNCSANGSSGDGAGIHVTSSDNRIDSNNVIDNDRGIDVDVIGNLIIRNSASGNTVDYDIVANNKVGVIVAAPNSVAISGSTGGAGVGTTDPWANISF